MEYTFNGCGEYMFVISNDNTFQIQVRFSQAVGAGFGTVISAVVLKVDGVAPIQINHNKNGKCSCDVLIISHTSTTSL